MSRFIKSTIPYFLIITFIVGLFSPLMQVNAQETRKCGENDYEINPESVTNPVSVIAKGTPCVDDNGQIHTPSKETAVTTEPAPDPNTTPFEKELNACNLFKASTLGMCLAKFFYYTYFQLPSWILYISAQFFSAMISLGIDSSLTITSGFIPSAWTIVRDFSNIFFILVLLYIAIQTILGLAHETKQMIVKVIIMALLINFSMFFAKVVIDSSNMLALVFYNKLEIKSDVERPVDPSRPTDEKDISGQMWKTFDATRLIGEPTILAIKKTQVKKDVVMTDKDIAKIVLPSSFAIGMIVIAGSIMLWASYAFFIAGLMFIGRLIELWVLIIFSPFAFMSWAVPQLKGVEYLGWDAWIKRLVSTSFMAPIFMFFMYLIFLLLPHIGKFNRSVDATNPTTVISIVLSILIPAIVIMALLLKATEFAKKGGGQFGELVMTGGKILGGLALGAATGGAALAARGVIGARAAKTASDEGLKALAASGDKKAQRKLALANSLANKSFDIRDTGFGKFVAKKSGMDFNAGTGILGVDTKSLEGGYKAQEKKKAEEQEAILKTYELSKSTIQQQEERHLQYEEDKKQAAENVGGFSEQDEATFKAVYERGGNLQGYGINKKVEKGTVQTGEAFKKEINASRRKDYADDLDKQREEMKGVIRTFGSDFIKGMKKTATSGIGINSTLIAGATTGGLGAGAVIAGGGFLYALKQALGPRATDADVAAMVRKGVKSKKEEALEHLGHAMHEEHEQEHGKEGGHGHEEHAADTHAAPAAGPAHPPAGGDGGHGGGSAHPPAH